MSRLFSSAPEREILQRASHATLAAAPAEVVRVAREHGVESLLMDAPGKRPQSQRDLAMDLAHLALHAEVVRVGDAFATASVDAILLKGLSIAQRFYDPPWSRPCTDVDLLVAPHALTRAEGVLTALGYTKEEGARGRFFAERHFHVSFFAEGRLPIELHFIAYRGFGAELSARDLLEGSEPLTAIHASLRAPSLSREIVYLAVHAAAHRFERMGWLLDLALIARARGERDFAEAARFAESRGFRRPYAAAISLLREHFALSPACVAEEGPTVRVSSKVALAMAHAPPSRVASTATRLLYTLLLCDGPQARARYLARALVDKMVMTT